MNKTDKRFFMQFDQANRDFTMQSALYAKSQANSYLALSMSLIVLLIAVFPFILNISTFFRYMFFISVGAAISVFFTNAIHLQIYARKNLTNANLINEQLQDLLLNEYPDYENKHR